MRARLRCAPQCEVVQENAAEATCLYVRRPAAGLMLCNGKLGTIRAGDLLMLEPVSLESAPPWLALYLEGHIQHHIITKDCEGAPALVARTHAAQQLQRALHALPIRVPTLRSSWHVMHDRTASWHPDAF